MNKVVASVEHEKTLQLAKELVAVVTTQYPDLARKLTHEFIDIEKFHAIRGAMLGIERESHESPIGEISGVPYSITTVFKETIKESRVNKHLDPEMFAAVVLGSMEIKVAPHSRVDDMVLPTAEVIITMARFADEEEIVGPDVLGIVPKVQTEQTIRDSSLGISVSIETFDPEIVPKHFLSLTKIAFSKDPELGDYALRSLNELLEAAVYAFK